ncbi:MAG: hypothetical protein AB1758_18125, partial [Candidatus Eremiobacterota bacterium]
MSLDTMAAYLCWSEAARALVHPRRTGTPTRTPRAQPDKLFARLGRAFAREPGAAWEAGLDRGEDEALVAATRAALESLRQGQ